MIGMLAIHQLQNIGGIATIESDLSRLYTFTSLATGSTAGSWWMSIQPTIQSDSALPGYEVGRSLGIHAFIEEPSQPTINLMYYRFVNRVRWVPQYAFWEFVGSGSTGTIVTSIGTICGGRTYNEAQLRSLSYPALWNATFEEPLSQSLSHSVTSPVPAMVAASPRVQSARQNTVTTEQPQPMNLLFDLKPSQTLKIRMREFRENPLKNSPPSLTTTIPSDNEPSGQEDIVALDNFGVNAWALKIG